MDIGAVRQAMANALAPLEVQVNPYMLASPTPPGVQIPPPAVTAYDFAVGIHEWEFIVQGFVALSASDIGSQKLLDKMCQPGGATSVRALLEADRTLAGTVDNLHVVSQEKARTVEPQGGIPLLLVEWRVQVYANGG